MTDAAGTVYYLIPDIYEPKFTLRGTLSALRRGRIRGYAQTHIWPKAKPVGGIKVMYQHCLELRAAGIRAELVSTGVYTGNYFDYPITPIPLNELGFDLKPQDVVVAPEIRPYLGLEFKQAHKVMFAQNSILMYDNKWNPADLGKSFVELGYDSVMTCSEHLRTELNREPAAAVTLVNNFIDHRQFCPAPERRNDGLVMALPRKNPQDLEAIRRACPGIQFNLVDNVSQAEMVQQYQCSDVFLATGYPEGFGLPPLEAMACGAAVVGFTGGAAAEYMIHNETALVVPDGDTAGAASELRRLLSDGALRERLRLAGLTQSQIYTADRVRQQLVQKFAPLTRTTPASAPRASAAPKDATPAEPAASSEVPSARFG